MELTALIVAEGECPDIGLTLSSVSEITKEILLIDIGIESAVKKDIIAKYPAIRLEMMERPEYVELIRQPSFQLVHSPWILLLDPDEYLSPDLIRYLKEMDEDVVTNHTHFKIPRQNYIFGKWIAHSRWWPDYQIRLFRKDSIDWPPKLHAQPVLTGSGYIIPAFENEKVEMNARTIVHHNYTSIVQYLDKAMRYAKVEAQEIIDSEKELTLLDACRRATSEFISRFFADKGYKDGAHGFVLAILQMFVSILVFLYVWEKRGYPEMTTTTLIRGIDQLFIKTSKEIFYWLNRERITKGAEALISTIRSKLL